MEKTQRKVIFLDRDGVMNEDPMELKYVTKWAKFKFLPGVKRAIKKLTDAGYSIYVVSNQAGIAKKYYSLKALRHITKRMLSQIKEFGGRIKAVFYCPHRDEDNCGCRKPKTGLFRKALKKGKIDFSKTFFIGDNIIDVEAGRSIGCKTILVLCGKEQLKNRKKWQVRPHYIKRDLLDAVNWILKREGKV